MLRKKRRKEKAQAKAVKAAAAAAAAAASSSSSGGNGSAANLLKAQELKLLRQQQQQAKQQHQKISKRSASATSAAAASAKNSANDNKLRLSLGLSPPQQCQHQHPASAPPLGLVNFGLGHHHHHHHHHHHPPAPQEVLRLSGGATFAAPNNHSFLNGLSARVKQEEQPDFMATQAATKMEDISSTFELDSIFCSSCDRPQQQQQQQQQQREVIDLTLDEDCGPDVASAGDLEKLLLGSSSSNPSGQSALPSEGELPSLKLDDKELDCLLKLTEDLVKEEPSEDADLGGFGGGGNGGGGAAADSLQDILEEAVSQGGVGSGGFGAQGASQWQGQEQQGMASAAVATTVANTTGEFEQVCVKTEEEPLEVNPMWGQQPQQQQLQQQQEQEQQQQQQQSFPSLGFSFATPQVIDASKISLSARQGFIRYIILPPMGFEVKTNIFPLLFFSQAGVPVVERGGLPDLPERPVLPGAPGAALRVPGHLLQRRPVHLAPAHPPGGGHRVRLPRLRLSAA